MKRNTVNIKILLLLVIPILIWVTPVYAGGWATIGVTKMPDEIHAGQPFALEFMVWQHGNKAVHELVWNGDRSLPVTPLVKFISPDSKEAVTFSAEPAKIKGLFTAEITLPADGVWEWSISPEPLAGVTGLEPLTVLPPVGVGIENSFQAASAYIVGQGFLAWAAGGVIILLGFLILFTRSTLHEQAN